MKNFSHYSLPLLRGDIYGGLTAAVVALPLALAFGVASGAGPIAGLYGAIFVGFFAALLGGTPSQISGPTGPMTVVMATIFITFADTPGTAITIIILGGIFQILFGLFRLGELIWLVPFTVISGFMSGIGVIIIILQLPPLLGHAAPPGGLLAALMALPNYISALDYQTLIIGLAVLAIVMFLPQRLGRLIPSPLLGLLVGTLLAFFYFPDIKVLGDIPTGFPELRMPALNLAQMPSIVGWALVLALLGSIDSLLTSLIADSVTRTHHRSNKELMGQGVGNVVAGLFGGIPGAGATMRTLVNVRAGGSTPASGIIHALVLLAIALEMGPLASYIPHTVLAGILIKVGIDIIDWKYLKHLKSAPRACVVIMGAVLLLTVFVDLIVAFATGMIAASLLFVKRMSDHQINAVRVAHNDHDISLSAEEKALYDTYSDRIAYFQFSGPLSFGAAKEISRRVAPNADHNLLILDLEQVPIVDTTGAFAIDDIITNAHHQGVEVILISPVGEVRDVLKRLGVLNNIQEGHLTESRLEAFNFASTFLNSDTV